MYIHSLRRQRGVSLFIVLIILLLSLIVVLGGLAVSNLNEALVGNQSDAQRAYGAAQALIDAAQRDIQLNGRYCGAPGLGQQGTNQNFTVVGQAAQCFLRYPSGSNWQSDYMNLIGLVGGQGNCGAGNLLSVCIPNSPTDPNFTIQTNNNNVSIAQTWANGSAYNNNFINILNTNNGTIVDYGGTATAGNGTGGATTPLALGARGEYWVEIFPYNVVGTALAANANITAPEGNYPFVFRITAMAQGLRGGTVSVLRTYYVPYPQN